MISSSTLVTGNTFTSFQNFASCLGLKIISEKTFHNTQRLYLCPVLSDKWEMVRKAIVSKLKERAKGSLSGNGRCDRPGHSAKYGTYIFMDNESHKSDDFTVIQVSEVSSSNAMEKSGFEGSLNYLDNCGVKSDYLTLPQCRVYIDVGDDVSPYISMLNSSQYVHCWLNICCFLDAIHVFVSLPSPCSLSANQS